MSAFERFKNTILSIAPAENGWQVTVQHRVTDTTTNKTTVDEERTCPVVTWALVETTSRDGSTDARVEPVFYDGHSLKNSTEYRRMHSDVAPEPGDPKLTVDIKLARS